MRSAFFRNFEGSHNNILSTIFFGFDFTSSRIRFHFHQFKKSRNLLKTLRRNKLQRLLNFFEHFSDLVFTFYTLNES